MRILFIVAALFILAGCETMAHSVTVSSGHHYPSNHISYTLGFYSGSHYNGYSVYGSHGHRYYYAPRYYTNHHYYSVPHHYVAPRPRPHHVQPRNHHTQAYVQPQVRSTPHRQTPPRQRNHRNDRRADRVVNNNRREERVVNNDRRENRQDRRRGQNRKRK